MDSLIFELQIVFYFQLFLSANVRHSMLRIAIEVQGKHAQKPNLASMHQWYFLKFSAQRGPGKYVAYSQSLSLGFKSSLLDYAASYSKGQVSPASMAVLALPTSLQRWAIPRILSWFTDWQSLGPILRKQMLRILFIPFNFSRKTTSLRSSVSLLRSPARCLVVACLRFDTGAPSESNFPTVSLQSQTYSVSFGT